MKPLLILDDPFSALDKQTEKQVFENVRELCKSGIVLLISHRLYLFPQLDGIIWIDEKHIATGTHDDMMKASAEYRQLFAQQGGLSHEE